jgi:sortase (surface protein transpeptidase)
MDPTDAYTQINRAVRRAVTDFADDHDLDVLVNREGGEYMVTLAEDRYTYRRKRIVVRVTLED